MEVKQILTGFNNHLNPRISGSSFCHKCNRNNLKKQILMKLIDCYINYACLLKYFIALPIIVDFVE